MKFILLFFIIFVVISLLILFFTSFDFSSLRCKYLILVVFSNNTCRIFNKKLSKRRIKRLRIDNIGNPIIAILSFHNYSSLNDYIKEHNLYKYYGVYFNEK